MALNPLYVTAPSIQQYFVDKDTGEPLSGGYLYFYHDNNRTEPKSVYTLAGNQANYSYVALPNPLVLSGAGIPVDANGNPIVIYWYPFDDEGNLDLYYVRIVSSTNVPQQTVQAWPNGIGSGITPGQVDNVINYIPNGQMLAHTNPPNNMLVGGSNVIAQGGFSVELPDPVLSTNTLTFEVEGYVEVPPNSPRYLCVFECTNPNTGDASKIFRIKWNDVNKFAAFGELGLQEYTFAFWATSSTPININVTGHRYFGTDGSVVPDFPIGVQTITGAPTFFNFNFSFPSNAGYNVDTVDNNDFISIDISFPLDIAFVCTLTDFVMSNSVMNYIQFPLQTNADMMTRGVMGWVDVPDGNGMNLFLPPLLTKYGMTWDFTQIGDVGMSVFPIDDPKTENVANNRMPCDGATYIASDFAMNGIPYARLGDKLRLTISPNVNGVPLYGTGANYVTALIPFNNSALSVIDTFRITYNAPGTGSPLAANGLIGTGFTFDPVYLYAGSPTGIAGPIMFASSTGTQGTLFVTANARGVTLDMADNNTGFGFTVIDTPTGLMAFQNQAYLVSAVSGASLVISGAGRYFLYTVGSTNYYMWFNVGGANTDPSIGGRISIQVNINSDYSAFNVADVVRDALIGNVSTNITVDPTSTNHIPPEGSYFTFSSNPSSLQNYFVWYTYLPNSVPPVGVSGTGIKVYFQTAPTPEQVRDQTRFAINAYQFQAPDFRGMFFRCADPNSSWDFDAVNRWSPTPGVGGANPGTYEFSQFLLHNHNLNNQVVSNIGPSQVINSGGAYGLNTVGISFSGGSETRPVNTYIYPFIRY